MLFIETILPRYLKFAVTQVQLIKNSNESDAVLYRIHYPDKKATEYFKNRRCLHQECEKSREAI